MFSGLWLTPDLVQDGNEVTYVISEGSDFELGRGTYTASGTTLSRDMVLKSKIAGVVGTSKMDLDRAATVSFTAAPQRREPCGCSSISRSGPIPAPNPVGSGTR